MKSRSSLTIRLNQLSLSINFQPSLQSRLRNMILWPTMFLEKSLSNPFKLVSLRPVRWAWWVCQKLISVFFNDSEQIKTFTSELSQISPELKSAIQKVELAPNKVTSDLIRLTMNDSDEVLVPLSEMSKKRHITVRLSHNCQNRVWLT